MKGLGIAIAGLLAIAGGVAAATIITKKKLEKENDEDYYDDWDEDIADAAEEPEDAPAPEIKKPEMVEEVKAPETDEKL
mgnify:CR=1 FL=1